MLSGLYSFRQREARVEQGYHPTVVSNSTLLIVRRLTALGTGHFGSAGAVQTPRN